MRQDAAPLAVVIVTYNSAAVLPGLLDSLAAGLEGVGRFEIVVSDNDSRDGSAELALAAPVGARVIRMERNAGYAAGINAAIATVSAASDVLILNPDVRLRPGAVRTMRRCWRSCRSGSSCREMYARTGPLIGRFAANPRFARLGRTAALH